MIKQAFSTTARAILRQTAIRSGLAIAGSRPLRQLGFARGRGLIFTLHHVRPSKTQADFAPNAHLEISPDFLSEVIGIAKGEGYKPVALKDLPDLVKRHPRDRFVAFSLDDGYRDNRDHAAPVFRKHDVPYTIFVTRGFADHTRPLWWILAEQLLAGQSSVILDPDSPTLQWRTETAAEKLVAFEAIAALIHSGHEDAMVEALCGAVAATGEDPLGPTRALLMDRGELFDLHKSDPLCHFGAHTLSHPNMACMGDDVRLAQEVEQSVAFVADLAARRPTVFAYPYGMRCAVNERACEAVRRAGIRFAVTTQPGVLQNDTFDADKAMMVPRVSINGLYQNRASVHGLLTGLPFSLPS